MNLGFQRCVNDWCYQHGTNQQYTKCKNASEDGRTCYNPTIRYGSTIGGYPAEHPKNDILEWCRQLFPTSTGTAIYSRTVNNANTKINGLFWCTLYDETSPHWCDFQDGLWKDSILYQYPSSHKATRPIMDSVTCHK